MRVRDPGQNRSLPGRVRNGLFCPPGNADQRVQVGRGPRHPKAPDQERLHLLKSAQFAREGDDFLWIGPGLDFVQNHPFS